VNVLSLGFAAFVFDGAPPNLNTSPPAGAPLPPNEKLFPGFAAGAAEAPFPAGFVSVFPNCPNVEVTFDC
jgi:hypothetical protein